MSQSNAHVWNLPVETTCSILSLCVDNGFGGVDVPTLRSCSLVSRMWNEIVLPLLFSDLTVVFKNQLDDEEDAHSEGENEEEDQKRETMSKPRHISTIPDLLQETGERFMPIVAKLRIVQELTDNSDFDDDIATLDLVKPRDLCNIIHLFPSIKTLHLVDIILNMPPEPGLGLQHLDLDELYLEIAEWVSWADLTLGRRGPDNHLWMLCLFGSVERLVLHGIKEDTQYDEDAVYDTLVGSSLRIKALEIFEVSTIGVFMDALYREPRIIAELESLDIKDQLYSWPPELTSLCTALPKGLTHLGLNVKSLGYRA